MAVVGRAIHELGRLGPWVVLGGHLDLTADDHRMGSPILPALHSGIHLIITAAVLVIVLRKRRVIHE